jgi:disulfide bond formation protein DsbB
VTVHREPQRTALAAARWLALLTPATLLAGAYLSQYAFGFSPCEMCWWQRYAHFAAMGLALLAFVLPARVLVAAAAGAIALSGLIAAYHAGIEYTWWPGMTACTASPLQANADPLATIMAAPLLRCDVAAWSLFGISLAGWNFLFSIAAALAIAILLKRGRTSTDG